MCYSIGIDIGGTKISSAIIHKSGQMSHKETYPTPQQTRTHILHLLQNIVTSYIKIAETEGFLLDGVGIGSAGQVDYKQGMILSGTDNIKDWNNVPIKKELEKVTTLPIFLDNDANTFAVAEYQLGRGRNHDHLVCLTLGTGIGGGVISDGRVIRGTWGGAAELGHMTVDVNGPECNCGSRGCIETFASGTGIAERMKERMERAQVDGKMQDKLLSDAITSQDVFTWAEDGFKTAVDVIDDGLDKLSYGIVNLIHIFNPDKIILGGGLIEHHHWLRDRLEGKMHHRGMDALVKPTPLTISNLGYDAGLIGAGLQIWLHQNV